MSARTVVLVGCGNMGFAMLRGWIDGALIAPQQLHVVEPSQPLRDKAAATGALVCGSTEDLPTDLAPDLVIFAVKPQIMDQVVPQYGSFVGTETTFLSVAAGTTTATMTALLGGKAPLVRVMPNTPAAIGQGMMVMYRNPSVSDESWSFVAQLMQSSGLVAEVEDETLMDAVTAISGSGPAYVFHMIEAMSEAGLKLGLPEDVAKLLAMQTVHGAGAYASKSDSDPSTLREQVTSPNGTTAAALGVLMGGDRLKELILEAATAARDRSVELGK